MLCRPRRFLMLSMDSDRSPLRPVCKAPVPACAGPELPAALSAGPDACLPSYIVLPLFPSALLLLLPPRSPSFSISPPSSSFSVFTLPINSPRGSVLNCLFSIRPESSSLLLRIHNGYCSSCCHCAHRRCGRASLPSQASSDAYRLWCQRDQGRRGEHSGAAQRYVGSPIEWLGFDVVGKIDADCNWARTDGVNL